jgi:hypothetical protein
MRLKKCAGKVAGIVILGLMVASCAMDDARDVQVRDSEGVPPAKVSPQQQLEQQRQLEERQRDQRQQDRRQHDLERAQSGEPSVSSAHASSITKVPSGADVVSGGSERIVGQSDVGHRGTGSAPGGSQVKGELLRMEGEYFVIRDGRGQEIRLQVTNATKMENAVQVGDKIEAHISGSNHAESIRSVDKPKSN